MTSFEDLLAQLNSTPSLAAAAPPTLLDQPLSASRQSARPAHHPDPGPAVEVAPGLYELSECWGAYPLWRDEWSSAAPGDVCVKFKAKALDNIALCFSVEKESTDGHLIEIVIGGWKNTKSVIRTRTQGAERAVSTVPRTCNANEFREYWATLKDGVVACGLGDTVGAKVIVAWRDPSYAEEFEHAEPCWVSFTTWDHSMTLCDVTAGSSTQASAGAGGSAVELDVQMSDYQPAYIVALEDERKRNVERASRFGVEYVEPDVSRVVSKLPFQDQQVAKARVAHVQGFVTGFDTETEEERERRLARKARFGLPEAEEDASPAKPHRLGNPRHDAMMLTMMLSRLQVPRRDPEPDSSAQLRDDALHLHGDFGHVFTKEVLRVFDGFGPTRVEWLDDCSANVVFEDAFTTTRALGGVGKELPADSILSVLGARGWRYAYMRDRSREFKPVLVRTALTTDVKTEEEEHRTMRRGRRRAREEEERPQVEQLEEGGVDTGQATEDAADEQEAGEPEQEDDDESPDEQQTQNKRQRR